MSLFVTFPSKLNLLLHSQSEKADNNFATVNLLHFLIGGSSTGKGNSYIIMKQRKIIDSIPCGGYTINGKIFILTPLQGRHVFRFPATVREISRDNIYNYPLCTVIIIQTIQNITLCCSVKPVLQ